MLVLTTLRITPCSHFRDPSDNFGKSIGRTSTFPGPTYTTPRLLAINVRFFENLECFGASFRHGVNLIDGLGEVPVVHLDDRFPCLLDPGQDLLVLDLQFGISLCLLAYPLPEGVGQWDSVA